MKSNKLWGAMRLLLLVAGLCLPALIMFTVYSGDPSSSAYAQPQPNSNAGFLKKGRLDGGQRRDTYWYDTDGVSPGVAGCHIEVRGKAGTAEASQKTGRTIGEKCEGNILIETNPGAKAVHVHPGDIGHPDRVDCAAWCRGAQLKSGGRCVPAPGPGCQSARCQCN